NEKLSCRQVIEAVLQGLAEGKEKCGVEYNVIACAMRHHSPEQNRGMFQAAEEFLGKGLCALDLAGNEAAFPMKDFSGLFEEASRMGFPFTLHAGECGSVENIIESIKCGAARIGHGIAMRGQREVIALCRNRHIGIEMCPVSNLQTKAVPDKSVYPLREFLDSGLLITVNTDNRAVSNTTITKEMEFIQREYGVRDEELWQLTRNAVEVSFAKEPVKERLFDRIKAAEGKVL
ncbi:MAG: adenosine deaminase, partial [Clostridiales bacterium]|nr:adenosine deaminase [Clostridiales bacterium]